MKKVIYTVQFVLFYLLKLVQSNLYIAYDILTPKMHTSPGIIWVPINLKSDFAILLFSNLVSMTPGTLSIDISRDKKQLMVHCLYAGKENNNIRLEINTIQEKIRKIIN